MDRSTKRKSDSSWSLDLIDVLKTELSGTIKETVYGTYSDRFHYLALKESSE